MIVVSLTSLSMVISLHPFCCIIIFLSLYPKSLRGNMFHFSYENTNSLMNLAQPCSKGYFLKFPEPKNNRSKVLSCPLSQALLLYYRSQNRFLPVHALSSHYIYKSLGLKMPNLKYLYSLRKEQVVTCHFAVIWLEIKKAEFKCRRL